MRAGSVSRSTDRRRRPIPSTRTAATASARTAPTSSPTRTTRASRSAPSSPASGCNTWSNRYGSARRGGVAFYNLDNEPDYWQFVHRDVHPDYPGYDDLRERWHQLRDHDQERRPGREGHRARRRRMDGVLLLAAGLAQRLEHGAGLRLLRQPGRSPRARRHPVRRVVSAAVRRRQPSREPAAARLPRSAWLHRARRSAVQVRGRHRAPADAPRRRPRVLGSVVPRRRRHQRPAVSWCRACATGSRATTPAR